MVVVVVGPRRRLRLMPRLQVRRDVAWMVGGKLLLVVLVLLVVLLVVVGINVVTVVVNDGAGLDAVPVSEMRGAGVGILLIFVVIITTAAITDSIISRPSPPSSSTMGR